MYAKVLTAAVLLVISGAVASADPIVAEPDAFPAGTDISNVFPGVTLSTVDEDNPDARVFALSPSQPYWASTGALVFGHAGSSYVEQWVTNTPSPFRYGALRADFSPPVASVSLDFIGNDPSDYGQLEAFDAQGILLLAVQTGQLTAGLVETLTVSNIGNIGYIIAGGRLEDTVCLDHLLVPEPDGRLAGCLLVALLTGLRRR